MCTLIGAPVVVGQVLEGHEFVSIDFATLATVMPLMHGNSMILYAVFFANFRGFSGFGVAACGFIASFAVTLLVCICSISICVALCIFTLTYE